MARLISMTVYAEDANVYASPSTMAIAADNIVIAQNASIAFKKAFPAASGSINTRVVTNSELNNAGEQHTYAVGEALAALVTASA